MDSPFTLLFIGTGLVGLQLLAALPWLLAGFFDLIKIEWQRLPTRQRSLVPLYLAGSLLFLGAVMGGVLYFVQERTSLELWGRVYGALLQAQLVADLFVFFFLFLHFLWPKGAAVARAAFRESYRQPMFWLIGGFALALMTLSPFIPYFTFGEDYIMVKELGYDTVMLAAVLFGTIAASISISEEIEGRTAVTVMSKPISRRQFVLGKYVGILMASLMMVAVLGWFFEGVLLYKRWFDRMDPVPPPLGIVTWLEELNVPVVFRHFLRGNLLWGLHGLEVVPGLVMSSSLVMVLVALAVALATRLPMAVNLVTCLMVYFLSNLMPVLVQSTNPANTPDPTAVQKLLFFIAQLFDALLPGLELFRVRPTLIDEASLPLGEYLRHVGAVTLYGLLFTSIVLILGLVLFEDRDLA